MNILGVQTRCRTSTGSKFPIRFCSIISYPLPHLCRLLKHLCFGIAFLKSINKKFKILFNFRSAGTHWGFSLFSLMETLSNAHSFMSFRDHSGMTAKCWYQCFWFCPASGVLASGSISRSTLRTPLWCTACFEMSCYKPFALCIPPSPNYGCGNCFSVWRVPSVWRMKEPRHK